MLFSSLELEQFFLVRCVRARARAHACVYECCPHATWIIGLEYHQFDVLFSDGNFLQAFRSSLRLVNGPDLGHSSLTKRVLSFMRDKIDERKLEVAAILQSVPSAFSCSLRSVKHLCVF